MTLLFHHVKWLVDRLDPPCATCPAEVFPTRFGEMEQAVRTLLAEEKGFHVHVARKKTEWTITAHKGIWSGFAVICTPMYGAESFHPTEFSVRVRLDCVSLNLFVYPLLILYVLLIGLAWGAQLLGWRHLPGPGLMAFLAAVLVILAAMMMGVLIGLSQKIAGNYARMMAQLAEIKQLACTVLAAGAAPSDVAKRSARRFRLVLGGLLAFLGTVSFAGGCVLIGGGLFNWNVLLAGQGNGALVLGGMLVYEGALLFFLTYLCWRRPRATQNPPLPGLDTPSSALTASKPQS